MCYREKFDRSKIHRVDKICLELGTFGEFAPTVLQTLAKRCHHVITFFYSATEINGA